MIARVFATALLGFSMVSPVLAETATVDGIDIYWTSEGEGPAVLLVHGWTCDTTVWTDQIAEFADRYKVIALDLPGHGLSGTPADGQFTMELYAKAVEAVRVDAGVDEIVLVGHSMGAPVISQYALDYPAAVAGLVAVDGGLLPPDPTAESPLPDGPFRQARERLIRSFFVPETTADIRDKVLHVMLAPPDERALAVAGAMATFSVDEGEQIDAPALVVLAGTAEVPGSAQMQEFREFIPDLEVEVIDRTGHFLMMEEPGVFNHLLGGFLQEAEY